MSAWPVPTRTTNALARCDLTLADAAHISDARLLTLPGIGIAALEWIRAQQPPDDRTNEYWTALHEIRVIVERLKL